MHTKSGIPKIKMSESIESKGHERKEIKRKEKLTYLLNIF
jgi:hypothetical protein